MEPKAAEPLAPQVVMAMPMIAQHVAQTEVAMSYTSSAPATLQQPQALAQPLLHPHQPPPARNQGQFQFMVPQGHVAGQSLMFNTPEGLQVAVPISSSLAPGSLVTAQYPIQSHQTPALPNIQVQSPEVDGQQAKTLWFLYGGGWFVICCGCSALGPLIWLFAAGLYYCKPAESRNQAPQARRPAQAALCTCVSLFCVAFLLGLVFLTLQLSPCDFDHFHKEGFHCEGFPGFHHFRKHNGHEHGDGHGRGGPPGHMFLRMPKEQAEHAGVPKARTENLAVRSVESIHPEASEPEHHEVLAVRDNVSAIWAGDGLRYSAKVASLNSDGTVTVDWADGDSSHRTMPRSQVAHRQVLAVGDLVSAIWAGDGFQYPATVASINNDGTITVYWDDDGSSHRTMARSEVVHRQVPKAVEERIVSNLVV